MRSVFLGTSEFAIPALDALVRAGQAPSLVVSAPSKPRGRGRQLLDPPLAARAKELGLPLLQPTKVNDDAAYAAIAAAAPDLLVVVAYGQILRDPLLALPHRGAVNIHGSLLPRWRGAAPIARAIAAGDVETGVSLQFMVRALDAGDVIDETRVAIAPSETAGELAARLAPLGAELLIRNLARLAAGNAPRRPQDESLVTYAKPLAKDEGRLAFDGEGRQLVDRVRAMTPWPAAYTDYRGGESDEPLRLVIGRAEALSWPEDSGRPGDVVAADQRLVVRCGDGAIRLLRLKRAGKREMDDVEFLRGTRLAVGGRCS
jgi:methionyl-tRNA formyltransferase